MSDDAKTCSPENLEKHRELHDSAAHAVELLKAGSMNKETYDRLRFRREDAAVRLGWREIKSPLDGTVLTRYHEPGEMVGPGTKLLTIADLKHPWAYVYVPQPMLSRLSAGMQVKGFVPEDNSRPVNIQ